MFIWQYADTFGTVSNHQISQSVVLLVCDVWPYQVNVALWIIPYKIVDYRSSGFDNNHHRKTSCVKKWSYTLDSKILKDILKSFWECGLKMRRNADISTHYTCSILSNIDVLCMNREM